MQMQGVGFWQFYAPGQVGPANEGGGSGLYGILAADQAFKEFGDFSNRLSDFDTPVSNCPAAAPVPKPNAQDCTRTQVKGLPGTG